MLAGLHVCIHVHMYEAPLANTKLNNKGTVARKAWNLVYCHGNKTVNLLLWTHSVESYCKESDIFYSNWLTSFFIIVDQNSVECTTPSLG